MVRVLFFDIGSTLVNESMCEFYRLKETAREYPGSFDAFEAEYISLCRQNLPAYDLICKRYDLTPIPWARLTCFETPLTKVKETLEYLHPHFRLGVIANQPLGGRKRLSDLGLLSYFDEVFLSAEEGLAKPDLRLFLKACEAMSVSPNECLMIGDRLDNDIAPAMALGMKTCWVKRSYGGYGNPLLLPKAIDLTIAKTADLLGISIEKLTAM